MGGGGGSSRGPKRSDLRKLEEVARKTIREASETGRHNVFISFAMEDMDEVNLLRGQAKNENSALEFNDWSLREPFDSDRADYIRQGIRERISQSSVTLVYLTRNTAKSKWVDWEVRESIRLGKGIVAVYKGDAPPKVLPRAIAANIASVRFTSWSHESITKAIERSLGTR
jgi:hypothetical protein